MVALELLANTIRPLHTSDSVAKALERMHEFKVYHLPIVENGHYLGLVAEEELVAERHQDMAVGVLPLTLLNAYTFANTHTYEVVRIFSQLELSILPVLDQQKKYLGVIAINNLLSYASNTFAINEPGGIIVLSISNRNNSLAHMAQIVEADNAQILSSSISSYPNSTLLEVTLKINRTDLSSIVAAFQRYEYEVKTVFNNYDDDNDSMDRYNSFMNYLNV